MNPIPVIIVGAFYGLSLWVEKPSVRRLKVISEPKTNFVRAIGHENDPAPFRSQVLTSGHEHVIYVAAPGALNNHARIVIDTDRRCLDWSRTDGEIFGQVHHSSGEIGCILFSIPLLPFAAPYLIPLHFHYRHIEEREQMSRHCYAILQALRGQIDAETEKLLCDAFRRDWRERTISITATNVEEAAEFLKGCDQLIDAKELDETGALQGERIDWVNDMGDTVASGYRLLKKLWDDEEHFDGNQVKLGQLDFSNEDAKHLLNCYRTRRDLVKDDQGTSAL